MILRDIVGQQAAPPVASIVSGLKRVSWGSAGWLVLLPSWQATGLALHSWARWRRCQCSPDTFVSSEVTSFITRPTNQADTTHSVVNMYSVKPSILDNLAFWATRTWKDRAGLCIPLSCPIRLFHQVLFSTQYDLSLSGAISRLLLTHRRQFFC